MVTVVIDTNVLISALVGHGRPRRLVTNLLEEHELITSREMITELVDVLTRAKFIGINSRHVNRFLSILVRKAEVVRVREQVNVIAVDPGDNVVLSTACEGNADYIVSGDKHLLDLKEFRGVRIVTVKEMLELLARGQTT
jgi:putative PIN family toxin of toxin-antitoxin system